MRKIAHWTETFNPAESEDILRDFALAHAEAAGPRFKDIQAAIRACRFRELCEFSFDYCMEGISPIEYYHARQAVAFFSKLEHLDIGVDKEAAAYESFRAAEDLCRSTNNIFKMRSRGEFSFLPRVESWLYKASRKIVRVLGEVPSWDSLQYRFGKGATTLTRKRDASIRRKVGAGASCSEELIPAAQAVLGTLPLLCEAWASSFLRESYECNSGELTTEEWYSVPLVIHEGKLEFVPKNARTHRATVTEPVLNGLVQLAHGDYMAQRLAAFGMSIRDQTRNQRLARIGSLTGELATLDLSSASDTLSTELVFDLLPLEWASRLNMCRTRKVRYKNATIVQEKFSSMGCGFTFPLETLIFWSLASAVCEEGEEVSVYGDDIILPSHRFEDLCELLAAVGFIPNVKKSFHTGPFRESCGADYYSGIDIRPYHQKDLVSGQTLFVLHNFYRRRNLDSFAEMVLEKIHPDLRIAGPDGYGDGHLVGVPFEPVRKRKHMLNQYQGYLFSTFTVSGRKDIRPLDTDFVLPAYSIYTRESGEQGCDSNRSAHGFSFSNDSNMSIGKALFRAVSERGHGVCTFNSAIPEEQVDKVFVKALDLPTPEKSRPYKRISIYTLG